MISFSNDPTEVEHAVLDSEVSRLIESIDALHATILDHDRDRSSMFVAAVMVQRAAAAVERASGDLR